MDLNNQKKTDHPHSPILEKGTIQHSDRKCGTHARVFSQTLLHGNSKNEIRQRNGRT